MPQSDQKNWRLEKPGLGTRLAYARIGVMHVRRILHTSTLVLHNNVLGGGSGGISLWYECSPFIKYCVCPRHPLLTAVQSDSFWKILQKEWDRRGWICATLSFAAHSCVSVLLHKVFACILCTIGLRKVSGLAGPPLPMSQRLGLCGIAWET